MRLHFLFLADAATGAEGKLYIHGGGLTEIHPPALPWRHPQIAVVFRLEVEPGDEARDHSLQLRVVGPQDEPVTPIFEMPLSRGEIPSRTGDRPIFVQAAITMAPLPVDKLGDHHVVLVVDGEPVGSERLMATDRGLPSD